MKQQPEQKTVITLDNRDVVISKAQYWTNPSVTLELPAGMTAPTYLSQPHKSYEVQYLLDAGKEFGRIRGDEQPFMRALSKAVLDIVKDTNKRMLRHRIGFWIDDAGKPGITIKFEAEHATQSFYTRDGVKTPYNDPPLGAVIGAMYDVVVSGLPAKFEEYIRQEREAQQHREGVRGARR